MIPPMKDLTGLPGIGWQERVIWLIIILALAFLVWQVGIRTGEAASELPPSIRVTAPVTGVYCAGPCCCGSVTVLYRNHYYTRASYCKWFFGLREGQPVTTTVRLWR